MASPVAITLINKKGWDWHPNLRLKTKSYKKLSLGEYGRQRTSSKFQDLVLSLGSQNSRVPETLLFQALFSQRKVSVFSWIDLKIGTHFYFFFAKSLNLFYFKVICLHSKSRMLGSCLFAFYKQVEQGDLNFLHLPKRKTFSIKLGKGRGI